MISTYQKHKLANWLLNKKIITLKGYLEINYKDFNTEEEILDYLYNKYCFICKDYNVYNLNQIIN